MDLTFTTARNPVWDNEIKSSLQHELEGVTGQSPSFDSHGIYVHHKGSFIGGLVCENHNGILWVDAVWVELAFRNQGIGAKLMQEVLDFAIRSRCLEIQLNTYFNEALPFFLACGFEEVAYIPNWKYGLNCYFMKRVL